MEFVNEHERVCLQGMTRSIIFPSRGRFMRVGEVLSRHWVIALATAAAAIAAIPAANSADLPAPVAQPAPVPQYSPPLAPAPADFADRFEVRFGGYYHGVGSVERNTADVSASFLTPRLNFFGVTGYWAYAIPRVQVGGNVNVEGRTSFAYADLAWDFPVMNWFYLEPFFGGAIHNGSLLGTLTMSDLGCRELFHVGTSVGVPFGQHWSVLGTFEHLSNGKGVFGTDCGTNQSGLPGATGGGNQGLNNYGVRVGYAF